MRSTRNRASRRRGVAVLLVILLLSVTLGLSYAMVRSQNTAAIIERNADRRAKARQAAIAGLMLGLKKMHTSGTGGWAGVGTTLTGTLSTTETFRVAYTTGDPTLKDSDADYSDYPYRVTLVSTGSAVDPSDSRRVSSHSVRAVVRLVPRKLADEPSTWTDICNHTLFQYYLGLFEADVPFRVSGRVRCDWVLTLGRGYNWSDAARQRYMTDLNAMRLAGSGDWRPFTGPVLLTYWLQESDLVALLQSMGESTTNASLQFLSTAYFSAADTYRIYPGGQLYTIPTLPQECRGQSFTPDPVNNPLGIFARHGAVNVYDNVTIQGTLIARGSGDGDVHIYGQNVNLLPKDLPALYGTDTPIRLPVAIVGNSFRVRKDAGGTLRGMLNVAEDFEIVGDKQDDIQVTMQVRILARNFYIRGRNEWEKSYGWWSDRYSEFLAQQTAGIKYFPLFLRESNSLNPAPALTIQPESATVRYHWNNLQSPIYAVPSSDPGLRWDLVSWTDNP